MRRLAGMLRRMVEICTEGREGDSRVCRREGGGEEAGERVVPISETARGTRRAAGKKTDNQ